MHYPFFPFMTFSGDHKCYQNFLLIDNVSNTDCQYLQYCGNLSKVVEATLFNTYYLILWHLSKILGKPLECEFLVKYAG